MGLLYEKSSGEEQHSQRVSQLCFNLAGQFGFEPKARVRLGKIGLLHDIGKLAIPLEILNKPGSLSEEEWQEIKKHPQNGYRFLSAVRTMSGIAEAVAAHHERWDGTGYPLGLKGEKIPLEARIVSVVDAYDAMVSTRPYRAALTHEEACNELIRGSNGQFDPVVVETFLTMLQAEN